MAEANGNEYVYVPKSILITGGAGFIGSHVIKRLIKEHPEYKVRRSLFPSYCTAKPRPPSCTSWRMPDLHALYRAEGHAAQLLTLPRTPDKLLPVHSAKLTGRYGGTVSAAMQKSHGCSAGLTVGPSQLSTAWSGDMPGAAAFRAAHGQRTTHSTDCTLTLPSSPLQVVCLDKLDYVASRNNLKEALAHPNFKVTAGPRNTSQ